MKRLLAMALLTAILITSVFAQPAQSSAATTKHVILWKLDDDTLQYYKAYVAADYLGPVEWENIIGGGKKKTIKVSRQAKYYLLDISASPMEPYKVTKKKFSKAIKYTATHKENGKKWYWGTACKITIRNGKVVQFVQEYQA